MFDYVSDEESMGVAMGDGTGNPVSVKLTAREIDVLVRLMRGAANKQIAIDMDRSVKTVEFHVSHLLQKCRASSRVELVAAALLGSLR
jgi:DNA-binding NarL/FixJ family response regulator